MLFLNVKQKKNTTLLVLELLAVTWVPIYYIFSFEEKRYVEFDKIKSKISSCKFTRKCILSQPILYLKKSV